MTAITGRTERTYTVEVKSDWGRLTKARVIEFARALAEADDIPDTAEVMLRRQGVGLVSMALVCSHKVTVPPEGEVDGGYLH